MAPRAKSVVGRFARGAIAAALAIVLAACAQIPTSGDPTLVNEVSGDDSGGYIITPSGPTSGESAEDVVRGFIEAGTGFSNDYAVAREYLASDFAQTWDPSSSVIVYDGQPSVKVSDDAAAVELSVGATVDADGHYTKSSANATVQQTFELVQEDGEWRISSAPDGVSIIRPRFNLIYTQQTLYFYDPDYSYRVPDVRWIADTSWAATRLVQLLLKGPSSWLGQGVVTTAFPSGTSLAVDSIPVSSSVATVSLTAQALGADTKTRQLMLLQLQSTLSGLSSVSKVQISVNGTTLDIDDMGDSAPVLNPSPQGQHLIVARGSEIGELQDDDSLEALTGLAGRVGAMSPSRFSVRSGVGAAVTGAGLEIVQEGTDSVVTAATGTILDPSIDPQQYVWAPVDGKLRVFDATGAEVSMAVSWLDQSVVGARISRDGTRVALLVSDGKQVRVLISGVVRDASGKPSEVIQPLELGKLTGTAVGVSWYSDQEIAVVVESGDSATATTFVVGGESETMSSTDPVSAVTASVGEDSLRLLLTDGSVLAPRGTSWLPVATDVTAFGYLW